MAKVTTGLVLSEKNAETGEAEYVATYQKEGKLWVCTDAVEGFAGHDEYSSIKAIEGLKFDTQRIFDGEQVNTEDSTESAESAENVENVDDRQNSETSEEGEGTIEDVLVEDIVVEGSLPEQNAVTSLVVAAVHQDLVGGNVWEKTGRVIENHRETFKKAEDKKAMAKAFTTIMDKEVDQDVVPTEGLDRNGVTITLRKKGNKVKWSSWKSTARMMQNTSTIFKGIELFGYNAILPDGILISRYALDQMIKDHNEENPSKEAPIDTCKRCVDMAVKKVAECEMQDLDQLKSLLSELSGVISDFEKVAKATKETAKA